MSPNARRAELAAGLAATRARIAGACEASGRADDVTLVVVTKYFPPSDVRLLHDLGVRDVGENRHPEARDKKEACADLDLTWHFIGSLQSNKAAVVASYVDVVHSLDRAKLVRSLASAGRDLDVLLQVDLDPEPRAGRGGARPEAVVDLARLVHAEERLRLKGVMAVAPLGADPVVAFDRLSAVAAEVRQIEPTATWVSAGMSGDLEAAIAAGATHVRVGSAVLGSRPVHR
ncbi:MAG TPA: YggS family pyridoxal phosphate-dependent enzyme [Nocardioidaceae bacterium]|nr:YggS family pyridoxal phosphate-dependent enzyme [Nocardioidaceae bacterium]